MLRTLLPEVLSLILNGPMSWAAVELWKTGDASLMANLRNGGVVDMDLSLYTARPGSRWPGCLKEFKLRRLAVKSNIEIASVSLLRKELMALNRDLRELSLDMPCAMEAIFNLDGSDAPSKATTPFTLLGSMPTPKVPKLIEENLADFSDLWSIKAFEKLETFSFTGFEKERLKALNEVSTALIPRSVTCLHIGSVGGVAPKALPPSLTHFTLDVWNAPNEAFIVDLPKTIEEFSGVKLPFEQQCYAYQVLPNLKKVSAWELNIEEVHDLFQKLGRWPRGVTTALLDDEDENVLLPLSPYLQHLWATQLPPMWINNLPPSLTSINALSIDWTSLTDNQIWPKSLTHLSLQMSAFEALYFRKLPRTLKNLAFTGSPANRPHGENREELMLQLGLAAIQHDDANQWALCKQDLLELSTRHERVHEPFVKSYIEQVEKGGLYGLPIGLTSLSLGDLPFWHGANILCPPNLLTLSIHSPKLAENANFFDHLPPYLREFSSSESKGMGAKSLRSWDLLLTPQGSPHFLNMQHLTSIVITTYDEHFPGNFMSLLPRSLRNLELNAIECAIDAQNLSTLPEALFILRLGVATILPANAWLHALPRSLAQLELLDSKLKVHENDLINCPPSLTILSAHFDQITLPSLMSLPRAMRRLNTGVKPTNPLENLRTKGKPALSLLAIASSFGNIADPTLQAANSTSADHGNGAYPNLLALPGWKHLATCYVPFWKIFKAPVSDLMQVLQLQNLFG